MKIRIISDLHIDVNKGYPFAYDDDVFTVICGDISGNAQLTLNWLDKNIKQGLFVAGNHMGYSGVYSIDETLRLFREHCPVDANLTFLENSHKVIGDMVFVGGVLWTDFKLGIPIGLEASPDNWLDITRIVARNMLLAETNMNDYVANRIRDKRKLSPIDTAQFHLETRQYISGICRQFPDKKIAVVTHHAPSAESVDERFRNSPLNPCFASDMASFILERPNIVLWCHGHMHAPKDYRIGHTRVICNPRGYVAFEGRNGFDPNLTVMV